MIVAFEPSHTAVASLQPAPTRVNAVCKNGEVGPAHDGGSIQSGVTQCPQDAVSTEEGCSPRRDDRSWFLVRRAGLFRDFLRAASVMRAELFVETEVHLWIDFRSLRDSGISWRFLAEYRAEVIQRESGHEHIGTTLGYAKKVQDRRGRYGVPFPVLPNDLVEGVRPPDSSEQSSAGTRRARKAGSSWSGRRDLNPRSQAPKACALPVCATPRRSRDVLPRPAALAHRSRALRFRP